MPKLDTVITIPVTVQVFDPAQVANAVDFLRSTMYQDRAYECDDVRRAADAAKLAALKLVTRAFDLQAS